MAMRWMADGLSIQGSPYLTMTRPCRRHALLVSLVALNRGEQSEGFDFVSGREEKREEERRGKGGDGRKLTEQVTPPSRFDSFARLHRGIPLPAGEPP